MKLKASFLIIIFLSLGVILAGSLGAKNHSEVQDVKYYFDNIEVFTERLPRQLQQKVLIRGRAVELDVNVVCAQGPCPPLKMTALEDANNTDYNIIIYEGNPLVKELKVGWIYTLEGILEKGVDFGRKNVYISNFDPRRIVSSSKD